MCRITTVDRISNEGNVGLQLIGFCKGSFYKWGTYIGCVKTGLLGENFADDIRMGKE